MLARLAFYPLRLRHWAAVMTLPNADRAVVPLDKLSEYCLNPDHPTGKHKARVFRAALGLGSQDVQLLRDRILDAVLVTEATGAESHPGGYGDRYVVDFPLTTSVRTAVVRTTWIVRRDESFPRLTSCFVL